MIIIRDIVIIVLLFVLNGVFAMSELAIVSARPVRLRRLADEGNTGAGQALELVEQPTQFLSTVQVGITLIGILAGAIGGATLGRRLAAWFELVPALQQYALPLGVGVTVVFSTYVSLVIGELVPKRIALQDPERIASLVAPPMRWLAVGTAPLVTLLAKSTEAVLRLLRIPTDDQPEVTEDELVAMLRESAGSGELEVAETELVERALHLDDIWVGQVMTPAPEIHWIDIGRGSEHLRSVVRSSGHSHYPVIDGSPDAILGFVRAQDLLLLTLDSEEGSGQSDDERGEEAVGAGSDAATRLDEDAVRQTLHPPQYLPLNITPMDALDHFRTHEVHLALLVDEYWNVKGLITPTDILQAVVGKLAEEASDTDPTLVEREDGSLLASGGLSVLELSRHLGLVARPGPGLGPGSYLTLGGLAMDVLDRVPRVGDHFTWHGHRFEIVDMDGRRVDKLLVTTDGEPTGGSTPPGGRAEPR